MTDEEWDMNKKAADAWKFLGWGCRWGCISAFLFPFLLLLLSTIIFLVEPEISEKVLWHGKEFYLQYESYIGGDGGYHLLLKVNDEKIEVLPHIYGYEKGKNFIYLAAAEGYGVINKKRGTADIVLRSPEITQIKTEKIQYGSGLQFLSYEEQQTVLLLKHTLRAYYVSIPWRDSDTKTVGDGRFQYDYARVGETKYHYFQVHGLYGDFDSESKLFDNLTGCYVNDKTQMMYVTSPQGYAIVDGLAGTCRVYFTDPALAEKDYQKDIYVLDSFEDFTPEEQEILLKVEQEGLK